MQQQIVSLINFRKEYCFQLQKLGIELLVATNEKRKHILSLLSCFELFCCFRAGMQWLYSPLCPSWAKLCFVAQLDGVE